MTAVFLFELDEVADDKAVALRKGYIAPRWEVRVVPQAHARAGRFEVHRAILAAEHLL